MLKATEIPLNVEMQLNNRGCAGVWPEQHERVQHKTQTSITHSNDLPSLHRKQIHGPSRSTIRSITVIMITDSIRLARERHRAKHTAGEHRGAGNTAEPLGQKKRMMMRMMMRRSEISCRTFIHL